MKTLCRQIQLDGAPVIEMRAGGYYAIIAPTVGSNVARLKDCKNKIEILRYHKEKPIQKLTASPEVYGLPTLYFGNRLNHGVLRASDATYQWPTNEKLLQNHIHGFLHKRNHTVVETSVEGDKAIAKTQYIYDEKDLFFEYYPVKFQADYEFILDENGLHYNFTLTNLSDKQMPYSVCNHSAFKAPFMKKGLGKKIRIQIPAVERCVINERCIPTGEFKSLSTYDEQYVKGTKLVDKVVVDNDIYRVQTGELDGKPFYGAIMTDIVSGKRICYEVDEAYKFFIIWNDRGRKGYYCPEPMTAMIDAPNLDMPADVTGYIELAPGESKTIGQHIFTN
ncbi:MAG: aldose 1-epimerase [Lachnospiraceae bacterium]|nr:aldose 1-epimerase [Lachnospiraceae bacterium]